MTYWKWLGTVVALANVAVIQAQVVGLIPMLPVERNFGAFLIGWIAGMVAIACWSNEGGKR